MSTDPSNTGESYRGLWFRKTLQLAEPWMAWKEPIGIGLASVSVIFYRKRSEAFGEMTDWLWAIVPIAIYWSGVLLVNGFRAPSHLYREQQQQILALGGTVSGRNYLRLSVEEITRAYREYTAVQADKLTAGYLGQWLSIRGPLSNVNLDFGVYRTYVVFDRNGARLVVHLAKFGEQWHTQLTTFKPGHVIRAIGRIKGIDRDSIYLTDCELIAASGEPAVAAWEEPSSEAGQAPPKAPLTPPQTGGDEG